MNSKVMSLYDSVSPGHEGDWLAVLTKKINSPEATDFGRLYKDRWESRLQKKGG